MDFWVYFWLYFIGVWLTILFVGNNFKGKEYIVTISYLIFWPLWWIRFIIKLLFTIISWFIINTIKLIIITAKGIIK